MDDVPVPKLRLVHYRDARGVVREILVEASTAAAIDRVQREFRRRERGWRTRHATFTDTEIGDVEAKPVPMLAAGASDWEGPRYQFGLLLGLDRAWPLAEDPCGRRDLTPGEYCLGCDRSGQDLHIPGPGAVARRRAHHKGPLRGGQD
jgi:hypothetical protein